MFEQYVEADLNIMKEVADRLEEKIKYINIMKNGNSPMVQEKHRDDPKFQYYLKCQENDDSVLPLLDYVYNKTLCLQGYTLSIGHCKGLAAACSFFGNANINRIILDNCGVDDEEFASMLIGIQGLKDFKKIAYRRNVFMQLSLDAMLPILQRKVPHHLEELRIENVKTSPEVTSQLIEALHDRSYLTKLALVNTTFNP